MRALEQAYRRKMGTKTSSAAREALNARCKYLNQCPEVKRLLNMRENEKSEITYLNKADGYHEQCLSASPESCSIYKGFENKYQDAGVNI